MGLNLHAVVRGSINAIHPDEEVQLLHSTGSVPDENGFAAPQYERTMGVMAQVQSEGDAALFHADMAGANSIVRKFYLFAPKDFAKQTAGIFRPLSRAGDCMVMMQSPPTRSTIVSDETVYKAVKDFELLMMSGLEATHVIAGNQNNLSLPDSRDYVVNTIIAHREIGTPVEAYEWDTATQKMDAVVSRLVEMSVQVDVYSDHPETARMRAESVATVARTVSGCDFFQKYGLSSLYADDVRNTTVVVDENQFVQRWTTTLHITYTHVVRLDVESTDAVHVGVHNVDVRFPPR